MELSNLETVKKLLSSQNLRAKKFLGQNFLVNEESLNTIVETAAVEPHEHIIEVGPGLGVLTKELIARAKHVTSIELDPQMITMLKCTFPEAKNLEILNQDALRFTPPSTPYKVVANIPYNITSPLLNHFLQNQNKPRSLTLLVQKEVAEKICAQEPDMTILSLQIGLFGETKYVKTVPARHFHPSPKVDSAIIFIKTYEENDTQFIPTEEALRILKKAKTAFTQRRKKILNTLSLRDKIEELEKIGIDPNRRPETLSIKEWQKLMPILT